MGVYGSVRQMTHFLRHKATTDHDGKNLEAAADMLDKQSMAIRQMKWARDAFRDAYLEIAALLAEKYNERVLPLPDEEPDEAVDAGLYEMDGEP